MKLLFKIFIKKQAKIVSLLAFLSFLVVMSMQITTTIWTRDLTLVNRIDQVKGTHTYILTPESYDMGHNWVVSSQFGLGIQRFDEIIARYSATSKNKINVENTYAFPYYQQTEYDIFVLGYTSEDNSNQYEVIKGKALSELTGYEIAISESYARQLKQEGKEPIGSNITYNINAEDIVFEVVSVIDFVNFNDAYVGDKGLKEIPLFDFPFKSVAYGNYETIQALTTRFPAHSKEVMQLRFDQYTKKAEQGLVKLILDSYGMDVQEEKIIAAYEITDYLSTNDLLYKHVSMFSLFGLLVSTIFSFIVFVRRQLKQNAANIGLLSIVGVQHKNLRNVILARLFVVFGLAFALFGLVNGVLLIGFQTNRSLANVIDVNGTILLITIALSLVYFVLITLISAYFVNATIQQSFRSLKTKQQAFLSNPQAKKRSLSIVVAFKSLFAHKGFFFSSMVIVSLLVFFIISNVFITVQMGSIYNEQTLGVTFDYLVKDAPFSHYEFTSEYAQDQVMIEKRSDLYFVDIDFSEYVRTYYKGNMLVFYTLIEPFTEVVHGDYPPDWKEIFSEHPENYRFTLASRKHMDRRNGFVAGDNAEKNIKQPERGYLFYAIPQVAYHAYETAATISGTVNTLIDNGWIMYVYRKKQMIEISAPYMEMYLINLKEGVDTQALELSMDQRNMDYLSYDQVTDTLNKVNKENQHQVFYFMSFMLLMLIITLVVNVVAYGLVQKNERINDDALFNQIGIQRSNHRKIHLNQALLYVLGVVGLTQLLLWIAYPILFDGVLKAYGLYYTVSLPTLFTAATPIILGVIALVLVGLNLRAKKVTRVY